MKQRIYWNNKQPQYWIWRKNSITEIGYFCFKTNNQEEAINFYSSIADNPKFEARMYDKGNLI